MAGKAEMEPWWGQWELTDGRRGLWQIGPLDLWLARFTNELRLLAGAKRDYLDPASRVRVPARRRLPDPESMEVHQRFVGIENGVRIAPALADRPVVSRPESPLRVPAGARATLYVGSPVWVQVHEVSGDTLLHEMPVYRLTDTWIGASTLEGELAYSSRTHGRLDWRLFPVTRHRVVTPVHIDNRGTDTLTLEKLTLPIPRLSLYLDANGALLWTQPVQLERADKSGLADVRLEDGPPAEAGEAATELAPPRRAGERRFASRAFSALF